MKNNIILKSCAIAACGIFALLFNGCNSPDKDAKTVKEFEKFIKSYEEKIIPLLKKSSLASWNANISGKEEDYKISADIDFQISKIFSNKEDYEKLKKFKESKAIKDPLLCRQLILLSNAYCGSQIDTAKLKKIIDIQKGIEKKFNIFRAVTGKDSLTDNEVENILLTSSDSKKLETVWLATKVSGKNVVADVIKLVKLRNDAAKELGFNNYHEMSLKLSEQDPQEIEKLFDQLDSLTKDEFAKLKDEMDVYFAKRYNIKKENLMPWHYQNRFFQEAPKIYAVDLDKYFKGKNLIKITEDYCKGLGMDISDIIKKSDLLEKKGKNQHAFCTDIDKKGDVRVLCNVIDNEYWMNTLMHEFGHAVYFKYIDKDLPFTLRDPAHTFTTEAIAELFGRFSSNPRWLKDVIGVSDIEIAKIEENANKNLRLQMLVFSRWSQVMYRFEKGMYENPDQDLNKLWWALVEKYQMLKKPLNRNEPDWASKIHIATYPCYYHNYLLGELLASQLYYYINENVLKTGDIKNQSFAGKKEVGVYFIEKVFKPGSKYFWNDMIEKATGEKLSAKYYAKQFVN
ncbi:MAG: M2 family metallopeptidase [Bacteroidetes bacterium]|nr:M2 family metallopeptidase [Bacteroidota bacterium]